MLQEKMIHHHKKPVEQAVVQCMDLDPKDITWEDWSFLKGHFQIKTLRTGAYARVGKCQNLPTVSFDIAL